MDSTLQLLILILLITTMITSITTSSSKSESAKFYETKKLARDLHGGKRRILALGSITSSPSSSPPSITLFISGLKGPSELNGGYQVDIFGYAEEDGKKKNNNETTAEPKNGHFHLNSSTLASLSDRYPRAINATSSPPSSSDMVLYLVSEAGRHFSSLVLLNGHAAFTLQLLKSGSKSSSNVFNALRLAGNAFQLQACYAGGGLHLSSSPSGSGAADGGPLTYYVLYRSASEEEGGGNPIAQMKFHGGGGDIITADACNTVTSYGKLCVTDSGRTIVLRKASETSSCYGSSSSVLNRLAAGYVGSKMVYLFNVDGSLYFFDRRLLSSSSSYAATPLISVTRKRAWRTFPLSLPLENTSADAKPFALDPFFTANVIISGITYLLLVLMSIGGCLFYYYLQRRRWRFEEQERKWRAARDRETAQQMLALRRLKHVPSDSDSDDSDAEDEKEKKRRQKISMKEMMVKKKMMMAKKEIKSRPSVDIYAVYAANRKEQQLQLQQSKQMLGKSKRVISVDRRSKMLSLRKTVIKSSARRKSSSSSSARLKKMMKGKGSSLKKLRGGSSASPIVKSGGGKSKRKTLLKGKASIKSGKNRRRSSSVPRKSKSRGGKAAVAGSSSTLVKSKPKTSVEDKTYFSFSR